MANPKEIVKPPKSTTVKKATAIKSTTKTAVKK